MKSIPSAVRVECWCWNQTALVQVSDPSLAGHASHLSCLDSRFLSYKMRNVVDPSFRIVKAITNTFSTRCVT